MFASTLAADDPDGSRWGEAARYLEPRGTPRALPPLACPHRVVVIPGVLSRCVAPKVLTFGDGVERLKGKGVVAEVADLSGLGGAAWNAEELLRHLRSDLAGDPRATFLLVAHSKGSVDAMEALAADPEVRAHVVALVTVAGAIGGSRIPEWIEPPVRRL